MKLDLLTNATVVDDDAIGLYPNSLKRIWNQLVKAIKKNRENQIMMKTRIS
jgi:hypothetical protein